MDWRSLMVAVDAGEACPARVALASRLAKAFGARLIGVAAGVATPTALADPYVGGGVSAETLTVFRSMVEEELERLRLDFLQAARAEGVEAEWRGRTGYPADVIRDEARAADVIVTGRRSSLCDGRAADPGDVLLSAGRPILLVPPTPSRPPLGAPAVVAWSETCEARRAVAEALPLLRRSSEVIVVSVVREPPSDQSWRPVCDQVDWLARHGVAAKAEVRASLQEVGDELLDVAQEHEAGLIVAGGYGHARLREWILGGVTRTLITQGAACVLLAH